MRENTLKQQLYAGKAAFGVMCTFPSPPVVEMLGHLGFDWILLDNEHSAPRTRAMRSPGSIGRRSRRSWCPAALPDDVVGGRLGAGIQEARGDHEPGVVLGDAARVRQHRAPAG